MKFPGVVAVLCVVPSGLVLHIGITSCTFPPWTEMSKKITMNVFQIDVLVVGNSVTLFRKDWEPVVKALDSIP